ncbi:MAG: SMC-Scp complex subunit ScpB [Clostridia bacterium]|nr:SMC-Scp complex subunit ScpB [Clostridia bacterium]
MLDNLENIIESILFVAGEAVDAADIASKIDAGKAEILAAAKKLQERYGESSGIQLQIFNNKIQLSSNPKYSEKVSEVLNPIRQRNLSKATLETAAIIAYKQPITRLEIEEIRGVGCDYAISILMEHGLIEVVGKKDTVGHPSLFGTTDEFLKRFNIESIDSLPDYNELMEQVKVIRSSDDRLYNHFEVGDSVEDMEKKLDIATSKIEDVAEDPELVSDSVAQSSLEESTSDDGNDYFKNDYSGTSEMFNGEFDGDDGNDYLKDDPEGDDGFFDEDDDLV